MLLLSVGVLFGIYVSTCNICTCVIVLIVYDTMGYINTVNQTAEASIASSIRNVQNTDSYKDRNGAVSPCNPSIVISQVSMYIA